MFVFPTRSPPPLLRVTVTHFEIRQLYGHSISLFVNSWFDKSLKPASVRRLSELSEWQKSHCLVWSIVISRWKYKLRPCAASVCSYSCGFLFRRLYLLWWRERERKMESVCGRWFLFFLGLLLSFLFQALKAWPGHWTRSLFLHPLLITRFFFLLSIFFPIILNRLSLHQSPQLLARAAAELSVNLRPASVCRCFCFPVCVTSFLLNSGCKSLTSSQPLSKALWY